MSKRTFGALGIAVAVSCGEAQPDVLPQAELAELCGSRGPTKILALEADERALFPSRHDDRVLVQVLTEASPTRDRIVSMGPCGEDLHVVLEGSAAVWWRSDPATPLLASNADDRTVHWIDAAGLRPALLVAHGNVLGEHDGHAYLVVDSEDGASAALVRMVVDGDAFEFEEIHADVSPESAFHTAAIFDGAVMVEDISRRLLEIDLDDGSTSIVSEAIDGFSVSEDERFVVWRAARDPATASLLQPSFVLDRETEVVVLTSEHAPVWVFGSAAVHGNDDGSTTALLLPWLETYGLAGAWGPFARAGDRVLAVRDLAFEQELWLFDGPGVEPRRLPVRGAVGVERVDDDEVWLEGPASSLVRLPLDGSAARTIAKGAEDLAWLGEADVALVRERTEGGPTDLGIVRDDGDEEFIVADVAPTIYMLNMLAETAMTRSLFYEATPESSTGHGLYFVELAD